MHLHTEAWFALQIARPRSRGVFGPGVDPNDPIMLAKLYDYVVHEDEPEAELAAESAAGGGAEAEAAGPACRVEQRRLRRALEAHPHFFEFFGLWQEHHWKGNGYAGYQALPT